MPTDMCALQDFDEPDKLQIQVDDIITIIEGRWVIKGLKIVIKPTHQGRFKVQTCGGGSAPNHNGLLCN